MSRDDENPKAWLWLTIPVAILAIIAAGSGLVVDGIYDASSAFVAGLTIGTDLITIVIALPVLVFSAIHAQRGSQRSRLIWLGILTYLAYNYMMTAFMVNFNALFLIYVALLGCSTYALIGGLTTTNLEDIKEHFTEKTPVKAVSIFFILMIIIFYPVWLVEILRAQIAGTLPRMINWAETPTHAFYVLDLAFLFPAGGLTGSWLWRKRAIGYALAGILLTTSVVEEIAIVSEMVFAVRQGHPFPIFPEILIYIIGSVITLGMLIWYFINMKGK